MKEKIIFDDYMEDIRDHQERQIHIVIVEDDRSIKVYENDILKLKKLKENK